MKSNNIDRCYTYITAHKYWEDKETGKVNFATLVQCDNKVQIPAWIMMSFVPKSSNEYYKNLCTYVMKNNKKLLIKPKRFMIGQLKMVLLKNKQE